MEKEEVKERLEEFFTQPTGPDGEKLTLMKALKRLSLVRRSL